MNLKYDRLLGDRASVSAEGKFGLRIRKVDVSRQTALFVRAANNPEKVKDLLGIKKEDAILALSLWIPRVSEIDNQNLKQMYLKVLPVFLSYSEIFKAKVGVMLKVIESVQEHSLFSSEKSLFQGWHQRFIELNRNLDRSNIVKKRRNTSACNMFLLISGTDFVDTIGYSELDYLNSFHRYLKYHKLHKYLYFFANLSYPEIMGITSANIRDLEAKVGILPMTTGARNAILRKLTDLHLRQSRLREFIKSGSLSSTLAIERCIEELKTIMKTPIRGHTIYSDKEDLENLLVTTLSLLTRAVLEIMRENNDKMSENITPALVALLKKAWSCECFSEKQRDYFNMWRYEIGSATKRTERRFAKMEVMFRTLYM